MASDETTAGMSSGQLRGIQNSGTPSAARPGAHPRLIRCDPDGRVFIETDGGQPNEGNHQMVVAHSDTEEFRRLFTGVTSDEITGLTVTPDRQTLFGNTQHPDNGDPTLANIPVLDDPPDGTTIPRDATFVITRTDGGIVGS